MTRRLYVDGVDLWQKYDAWMVGADTSLRTSSARESVRTSIARRHGNISTLGKYRMGKGLIVLDVTDVDPEAGIRSGYRQVMDNEAYLKGLLSGRVTIREIFDQNYPDAGRQAVAEFTDEVEVIEAQLTESRLVFRPDFVGSFWRDLNEHTIALSADLSPLRKGSAPIPDALFTVPGQGSSTIARITDVATGKWIEWNGAAPVGQTIRLDPVSEVGYIVASGDPWTGGVQKAGWVTVGPGGFEVSPGIELTGPTGAMIRARRSFL